MPAKGQRKMDTGIAAQAAARHLDEGLTLDVLEERYGMTRASLYQAVLRLRGERGELGRSMPAKGTRDGRERARRWAWGRKP